MAIKYTQRELKFADNILCDVSDGPPPEHHGDDDQARRARGRKLFF